MDGHVENFVAYGEGGLPQSPYDGEQPNPNFVAHGEGGLPQAPYFVAHGEGGLPQSPYDGEQSNPNFVAHGEGGLPQAPYFVAHGEGGLPQAPYDGEQPNPNFVAHGEGGLPQSPYDGEQPNPNFVAHGEGGLPQASYFVAHGEGGLPQSPYDGEQPNLYDDIAKQYGEELGDQYNEQAGVQYDEGSGNPYNEEQANLYIEDTGNQYEDPANSYQEEMENAFSRDISQQDNSQVNNVDDDKWPGWPGESVFRILVPAHKVGAIIGRKGEFIKKMCEETKARIKILDGPTGVPERAVMISAKDEPNAPVSPAMDGLLRVHKRITDSSDGESGQPQRSSGNIGPTRLLVPSSQAGSLIGKQGATIKSIQDSSKSVVRIVENVPPVALNDDRVVEIQGEPFGVHKAVELIASHLRKFLVDRSVLPLFETHMKMHGMPREQPVPPPQHWGPPQTWGPPPSLTPGGPGFGGNPQFMPPRPQNSYYPPPDAPPMEKQPHYGISAYGREAPPSGASAIGNQPPSHAGSQVTHNMHIPLAYADAVIGAAGASISYIRRHSGATVTIQESRGAPGEMTVEIIGTAAQVQTAQQLIQNFMAEAAPPGPPPASNPPAPPVDPSYVSYPPPYGAAPYGSSAAAGPPPQYNGGSYGGPTYPSSYGY